MMDWEVCRPAHLQDQACISPTCGVPGAESSQLGALLEVIGTAILLELLSLAQGQPASNGRGPPHLSWDFSKGSPKFQSTSQVVKPRLE